MHVDKSYQVKSPHLGHHLIRWLYSISMFLLLPIILLVLRKKLFQKDSRLHNRRFSERFGYLPQNFKANGVHIHCVSMGEINAAKGVIDHLLLEYPHLVITLTTSSVTGAVHAQSVYGERVQHAYLPIDLPLSMRRFYNRLKPVLTLVTEVEIWPNMVHQCRHNNIPIVLINARMTQRSLQSYKRLSWLFRHTLRQFSVICAQSSESFENFLAYGMYKRQLKLSRNMKFDLIKYKADEDLGIKLADYYHLQKRRIVVAASTHEPEEKMLLDCFSELRSHYPDLCLIIVPRHPHRFEKVFQIAKATGLNTQRLSDSIQADNSFKALQSKTQADCLVVDAMGWLKACYSLCNIAFIGGSFAQKGGHNALEAALYGKPMVMGPSIFNNPVICQHLQAQQALIIVEDASALRSSIMQWLEHEDIAKANGHSGSKVLLSNAGAIENTMDVVRAFLPAKQP